MTTDHHHTDIDNSDLGLGQKTLATYLFGVFLCVILTIIPFFTVMYHLFNIHTIFLVLVVSAILQFLVQVIFFLRLNMKTIQAKYNVYAFVFAIIVLLVIIGGSLWIMWHLNYNMMH